MCVYTLSLLSLSPSHFSSFSSTTKRIDLLISSIITTTTTLRFYYTTFFLSFFYMHIHQTPNKEKKNKKKKRTLRVRNSKKRLELECWVNTHTIHACIYIHSDGGRSPLEYSHSERERKLVIVLLSDSISHSLPSKIPIYSSLNSSK